MTWSLGYVCGRGDTDWNNIGMNLASNKFFILRRLPSLPYLCPHCLLLRLLSSAAAAAAALVASRVVAAIFEGYCAAVAVAVGTAAGLCNRRSSRGRSQGQHKTQPVLP
mmetsp:Transcript_72176/g.139480  ORF Transcript_72176/g.139480 Transcript_72176/m.139480 type:complete len:109 (+) Transcript_72176:1243-1569(+)